MTAHSGARRADLDWLRVIAFGLLIAFHAAVVFLPQGIPMIQNDQSSPVLQALVATLHQFRLSLLFLVSGAGVGFALRRQSVPTFLAERSWRLLPPLAFGIVVLVPPMVYLEKRYIGAFDGSFVAFYAEYFRSGIYPEGHLSWHHFWFLAYLYLHCLLAWPLFTHWQRPAGQRQLERWTRCMTRGAGLLWPVLPLLLIEVLLRAPFPGHRDLIHDWASFSHWFVVFALGFVFARSPQLLQRAQSLRQHTLMLAVIATGLLFQRFYDPATSGFTPMADGSVHLPEYLCFCALRMLNVWCWLLACLGYASRYLQRPGRVLDYLNAAVYPMFCLHLPIIVGLAYVMVPCPYPVATEYLALTAATFGMSLGLYELLKRIPCTRPLLGIKTPSA